LVPLFISFVQFGTTNNNKRFNEVLKISKNEKYNPFKVQSVPYLLKTQQCDSFIGWNGCR